MSCKRWTRRRPDLQNEYAAHSRQESQLSARSGIPHAVPCGVTLQPPGLRLSDPAARWVVGSVMKEGVMRRTMRTWVTVSTTLAVYGGVLGVQTAAAGGFGIAGLDAFLTTFSTGV